MGALIAVGGAIVAAISATAVAVAVAVVSIVTAIATAIAAAATFVYSVLAGVVIGAIHTTGLITSLTAVQTLSAIGALNTVGLATYAGVVTYAAALVTGIRSFMTAIHFKTLIQVHQIAYLVSEDYRVKVHGVYSQIVDYAQAVGVGGTFMLLALQNSKNVILDVSSMVGRKYDLGEVAWFNELVGYLKTVNDVGKRYQNDPITMLYDMEKILVKPSVDAKATVMQGVFLNLESIVTTIDGTVKEVTHLSGDINKLVNDLPEKIKAQILPHLTPINDKIKNFIYEEYTPRLAMIDKIINTVTVDIRGSKGDIRTILDKILYPGDYLKTVDLFDDWEREQQESKILDVVLRPTVKAVSDITELNDDAESNMDLIVNALRRPPFYEKWYAKEVEIPTYKPLGQTNDSKSWFVGDY